MKKFVTPSLTNEKYKVCQDELFKFPKILNQKTIEEYVSLIPEQDSTDFFGLHQNAEIQHQTFVANKMIQTILQISPRINF